MKHFILNSIKRIKQYSKQLDAESVLSSKSWFVFNDNGEKIVFMFRSNAVLLIVVNGKVSKGKWELLENNSLLIDIGTESYLYNSAFVENNLLALSLDGSNDCLIMIEEGLNNELALNSVEKIDKYLDYKYIKQPALEIENKKSEESRRMHLEEENKEKERIKQAELIVIPLKSPIKEDEKEESSIFHSIIRVVGFIILKLFAIFFFVLFLGSIYALLIIHDSIETIFSAIFIIPTSLILAVKFWYATDDLN